MGSADRSQRSDAAERFYNMITLRVQIAGVAIFVIMFAAQNVLNLPGLDGYWVVFAPFCFTAMWHWLRDDQGSKDPKASTMDVKAGGGSKKTQ